MSAIIPVQQRLPGLSNYHTAIKVEVASHNSSDRIDLSTDVWACSVGKTIKGAGRANLSLTPSRNFMNLIYPNDYINIYFDIGDGQGWTRVFFGLIDRVEEEYRVQESGTPQSTYHVICTDFTKIFDKTFVYFNPALGMRSEFRDLDFGDTNIGGLSMLSRGVILAGSPADVVQSFILLMLGFGTQWRLPASYAPRVSQEFRAARRNFILSQLESEPLRSALEPGVLQTLREKLLRGGENAPPLTEEERARLAVDNDEALSRTVDQARADMLRNLAVLDLDSGDSPRAQYIIDVLDLYTFVERNAIDGSRTSLDILENTGDVMSTLRQYSNEIVNELFFDLRPVSANGGLEAGSNFSRSSDEWGGNSPSDGHPAGIQYVPAVVMREYPFSTINNVDASNVRSTISPNANLGVMWLGAIFSNEPEVKGRHVIRIPSVAADQQTATGSASMADKHLDVAVLSENEIIATRLGRSDEDLFNLFELRQSLFGSEHAERYMMGDLLPLVTPISIVRNGLRVRQLDTIYARPIATISAPTAGVAPTSPDEEEEEEETEEFSTEVGPPILPSDGARFRGRRSGENVLARYGYRHRPGEDNWIFHNGIDIAPLSTEDVDGVRNVKGPPIRAIADGMVCVSAPNGVYNAYGEAVVIRHPQFEVGGRPVYSAYMHLFGRNTDVVGNAENHKNRRLCSSFNNGRFTERFVRKGEIIGWMGKTGAFTNGGSKSGIRLDDSRPGVTGLLGSGVHLHFEINFTFPPLNKTATPDVPYTPGSSRPTHTNPNNMDPDQFLLEHGVDLNALYSDNPTETEEDPGEDDGGDATGEAVERDPAQRTDDTEEQQRQASGGNVDNIAIRNMIARWTILQDHWYQHNHEYLSGTVSSRPAPEIRVGYRLDIPERSMSFYVEGVQHDWHYPAKMSTTLQVTRGQPNNPFPVYVLPPSEGLSNPQEQRRHDDSRLAQFFVASDPIAVRRALVLRRNGLSSDALRVRSTALVESNTLDQEAVNGSERVIPAAVDMDAPDQALEHARLLEQDAELLEGIGTTATVPQISIEGELFDPLGGDR